ncbi:MAG TPA: PIN domain-containing protein [Polyangiaceae bacterium]|jgi:predicted nucleic acid-binding protein
MAARAIVDTGFLVALLNGSDAHHTWAVGLLPSLRGPWLTAEACVSETVFLLEQAGRPSVEKLIRWLEDELVVSRHFLPEELGPVRTEMLAYGNRWVDFADACLVALSDHHPKLPVVSVDAADFSVYFRRRAGRKLVLPAKRR